MPGFLVSDISDIPNDYMSGVGECQAMMAVAQYLRNIQASKEQHWHCPEVILTNQTRSNLVASVL